MDPDYLNFSGPEQYLVSLYFMMTSFTTVGYGDIHQTNHVEQVFVITINVIGMIVFTASVSTVTWLIYQYDVKA